MKKIILITLFFLWPASLHADEIQLVSGEIISGRILARDGQAVYLQASGLIRNFDLNNVAAINHRDIHSGSSRAIERPQSIQEPQKIEALQPLPYPLIAFAYRALKQTQLTFDPYHTNLDAEDARALREFFILSDRSLAAFVQTLLWLQSDHRDGRSDALLHLEVEKILQRYQLLDVPQELKPVQRIFGRAIQALDEAFKAKVKMSETVSEKNAFENYIRAARLDLEKINSELKYLYSSETARNQTAWGCHLRALLSIELGLRSQS